MPHPVAATIDTPGSVDALTTYLRRRRGFDAAEVLAAKLGRLSAWFTDEGLDAAVVGVSGGIDSAVTVALLDRLRRTAGSPLRRVVAMIVPIEGPGATGQQAAADRALELVTVLDIEHWLCPLGDAHRAAADALAAGSGRRPDDWTSGQMLSVLRTPIFYGAAAHLQADGFASVVVGTTNRDEGAYLGFFGKASDATVDLQPISDLHKSEVRALAAVLGVPASIVDAAPAGDVWDGRDDVAMIGTDYDLVETVLGLRELDRDPGRVAEGLSDGDRLVDANRAVERLHAHNAHKYRVGFPAIHLDVLPRGVPGGQSDEQLTSRDEQPPESGTIPGSWSPPPVRLDPDPSLPSVQVRDSGATVARGVLTAADCTRLIGAMVATAHPEPVGVSGVRDGYGVGSVRATAWSPGLAADLWRRVAPAVPAVRFLDEYSPTDGFATAHRNGHRNGHRTWRVVGLSPLLRFMRYESGGRHLCHYDAGYDYGDGRRTLMSVVFFLSDAGDVAGVSGGALRFVDDGQSGLVVRDRNHADWDRDTRADEVLDAIRPEAGTAVVFDHRRCHDVEEWHGPCDRVIIRGDVVFEAIPDGRGLR